MIDTYKLKVWVFWPQTRAYLCTVAVAYSLNNVWRVPRDGFRYGGLSYGLLVTLAMVLLALPAVLLQLAVGQLSQQDAVGVWRAVPFFKGIGYMRLAISFIVSVCTIIYLAISATFFMFTLNNSIPFGECTELAESLGEEMNVRYASLCFNETILSPINEKPEYYIALVLVVVFLSLLFPFLLYNPVKSMKRIFYTLAPTLQVLWIIIISYIGDRASLKSFSKGEDWANFLSPEMWNTAIARALLTAQVAGGYLISSGDSIYSNSDVEWTSLLFVGTNVITIWFSLVTWFALGSNEGDNSVFGAIAQTYNVSIDKYLSKAWPLLIFATLFLSGIISMVCVLYPIYDRFRRIGGRKWRYLSIGSSVFGSAIAAIVLMDHSALTMLEDIVLPLLINLITAVEITAFVFIYGWRVLLEDVEFLAGRKLMRFWIWGWCAAPGIIMPFLTWWVISNLVGDQSWAEPPWTPSALAAASTFALLIFIVFAALSVARQVQYDILGKLITSFKPSRHWGPRDPIAHYYWLVRREEFNNQAPQSRYQRRQLGQFSGASSFLSMSKGISQEDQNGPPIEVKRRSNSDDWLYSYRRDYLTEMFNVHYPSKRRSKSFDWAQLNPEIAYKEHRNSPSCDTTPSDSFVIIENSTTLPASNVTSI